jgi:cobalt-zinc-cadmium efflux system outer membrane protein
LLRIVFSLCAIFAFDASALAAAADDGGEPRGVITLSDALASTLLRSPELEEFSWQVRAAEARMLQARLRPNPEATIEVEDVLGTGRFNGAREAQLTLQLSQVVELGGKRSARMDVAARAHDLSAREFEAKRVEILAEATRRFIRLLARQDELALARASIELGDATLSAVRRRVAAGADSPLEQKKAATALARARIDGEHAEHQLRVARYELASLWGSVMPQFERAEGSLFAKKAVPPYETLAGRLGSAPGLVRGHSEIALREAEIRLADARRVPNVTVGGGPRRLEGPDDSAFVFGLSVPLPVRDRNQGGVEEARALLRKSEGAAKATEARLRTLLLGLYQELLHADTALAAYAREIIPGAEESLVLSRNGFAQGRFSYLDLADAQRTLVQVRREQIETAASYHELILEIEQVLGGSLDGETDTNDVGPTDQNGVDR